MLYFFHLWWVFCASLFYCMCQSSIQPMRSVVHIKQYSWEHAHVCTNPLSVGKYNHIIINKAYDCVFWEGVDGACSMDCLLIRIYSVALFIWPQGLWPLCWEEPKPIDQLFLPPCVQIHTHRHSTVCFNQVSTNGEGAPKLLTVNTS